MAERTELSEERMRLIRRFMGEPESEQDARPSDELSTPSVDGPSEVRRVEPARLRPPRRWPVWSPRMPHFEGAASFRAGAVRLPGLAGSLRRRVELGWPVAAVVLGLLVGLLIARSL